MQGNKMQSAHILHGYMYNRLLEETLHVWYDLFEIQSDKITFCLKKWTEENSMWAS